MMQRSPVPNSNYEIVEAEEPESCVEAEERILNEEVFEDEADGNNNNTLSVECAIGTYQLRKC